MDDDHCCPNIVFPILPFLYFFNHHMRFFSAHPPPTPTFLFHHFLTPLLIIHTSICFVDQCYHPFQTIWSNFPGTLPLPVFEAWIEWCVVMTLITFPDVTSESTTSSYPKRHDNFSSDEVRKLNNAAIFSIFSEILDLIILVA